jgi:protein-disulfide isomerase
MQLIDLAAFRRPALAGILAAAAVTALGLGAMSPVAPVKAETAAGPFSAEQKKAIEAVIKDYLVNNPEVLMEAQQALEAKMEKIQAEKLAKVIAEQAKEIFRDPASAVAGNDKGDIPVVEFFDYNCGYCKRSFADMLKLVEADKNIRLVFKELPILSKGSEEAAKVALAARLQGKYWEVHRGIFESKAPANEANALKVAEKLGLDMARLKKDMDGPEVKAELNKTKELAARMGINGTPHFLVGDRSIPGAPENLLEQIKKNAAELRKDGCKVC